MIFVRDKGRMCNNILQFGHLYAWAKAHGRNAVSMRFAYKYRYFAICDTKYHSFPVYVMAKYAAQWHLLPTVSFDTPEVDIPALEQQLLAHRHVLAEGWYARWYDLFLQYKADILRLFAFHADIEAHALHQMPAGKDVIKVGLHIRRGDYATWQGGRFLYTDAQFIHILQQLKALMPESQLLFYICGNDPQLNKDAYRQTLGEANVRFPDGNPGQDLCLLSHCDYLIGAPSTFTLVASMYQDTPLYWIMEADKPLTMESFKHFDYLFRHIL